MKQFNNNSQEKVGKTSKKKFILNFKRRISSAFDFVFPNFTCLICDCEIKKGIVAHLCDTCFDKVEKRKVMVTRGDDFINKNKESQIDCFIDDIISPFKYNFVSSKLVMRLKYGSDKLPAEVFSKFMTFDHTKYDFLLPVPLSKKRLRQRGYNQSEIICGHISKQTGLPILGDFVIRTKNTTPQEDMTAEQRFQNQSGAFDLNTAKYNNPQNLNTIINGKRILIVDDVITSGATVNTIAKLLKENGAYTVSAIACAVI